MKAVPIFKYIKQEQCCMCSSCVNICHKSAIHMEANEEGFLYPILDETKCCDCNQCIKVCPIIEKKEVHKIEPVVYGGYISNRDELVKSASGGAFTELAKIVMRENGYIAGAIYSKDFREVYHICSNEESDIQKMRGSKYSQSDKKQVYTMVQKLLKDNKLVFFTGLPCEIAGLRSFLKQEYSHLITCELICHGVTSPLVNYQYIDNISKKYKSKLRQFTVRYKNKGQWTPPYIKANFDNGKVHLKPFYSSSYGTAFSIMKRESCYQCQFKGENTQADLTIGDYWGKAKGDIGYNPSGVSVIIAQTLKGKELVEKLEQFNLFQGSYKEVVENNLPLIQSTVMNKKRTIFCKYLKEKGLEIAAQKGCSLKERVYKWVPSWVYRCVPKKLIRVVKEKLNQFTKVK